MRDGPSFHSWITPEVIMCEGQGGYSVREFRRLKIDQKQDLRQNGRDENRKLRTDPAARVVQQAWRSAPKGVRWVGVRFEPRVCVCGVGLLGAGR